MSSVRMAVLEDHRHVVEQDEWVEVQAPRAAAIRSGAPGIAMAISRIRNDYNSANPSTLTIAADSFRDLDQLDHDAAEYAADRWDD